MGVLKDNINKTRDAMERSKFSSGLRQAVKEFFAEALDNLELSATKTDEIGEMMSVMYRKFSTEHGSGLINAYAVLAG